VPDRDRGDAGLEGFTRTAGLAYQAYGCDEPISTSERYEKQRIKMTQDISKFINNRRILNRLLGAIRITRWTLFVPCFDSKEIVAHATKKTAEVVAAHLPYVAPSFQVHICQESDFAVARDQLINASDRGLHISVERSSAQQIADWVAANPEPSSTLADKVRCLPTLPNALARSAFQNKVLDWYLQGQEILQELRKHPDIYANVINAKSHREDLLLALIASGVPPQDMFMVAINELRSALDHEVRQLHSFSSEKLAYEGVSDWLLRCPLYFPEVVANA
jgi:hypothetical protein